MEKMLEMLFKSMKLDPVIIKEQITTIIQVVNEGREAQKRMEYKLDLLLKSSNIKDDPIVITDVTVICSGKEPHHV